MKRGALRALRDSIAPLFDQPDSSYLHSNVSKCQRNVQHHGQPPRKPELAYNPLGPLHSSHAAMIPSCMGAKEQHTLFGAR